ncbi:MAG: hypothetical protein V3V74_07740 [Nitrosomonadaceae bacterium]
MKAANLKIIIAKQVDKYWDAMESCDEPEFSLYTELYARLSNVLATLNKLEALDKSREAKNET